jgi:hypothetical protein
MERTNRFVLSPPEKSIPSINHQQSGGARPMHVQLNVAIALAYVLHCSCVLPFRRSRAGKQSELNAAAAARSE